MGEKMKVPEFDPQHLDVYDPSQLFDNQVMTVTDLACFLKCSTKKIYILVSNRQVPFKRVGRQIRFHLPDIQEWLKGG